MHFVKPAALLSILSVSTLALAVPHEAIAKRTDPTVSKNALTKRANPTIGSGIDTSDPHKGGKLISPAGTTTGAFSNAYELMAYANMGGSTCDAVFAKYFNPGDRQIVTDVFDRLLGPDGATGAAAMANIKVISGDTSSDPDDPAPAALEDFDTEEPNLVLTDDAFVYPNRDDNADACSQWADEGMTTDMYLLGSILLHEYAHWDWFLGSIHGGDVIDQPGGYGWEGARALNKDLAKYNADSYGWYATETFWAIICGAPNGYNAPGVEKRTE